MQELEKILEEIDQEVKEYMEIDFGYEYNAGIKDMAKRAGKIIKNHLSRENDPETARSSRDTDVLIALEVLDKLSFFGGQRAGRELWNDKSRKVQDEDIASFNRNIKYLRDLIRKHMNDGWISVEDRLPEAGEYVLGTNQYNEVLVYHYGWNSPHTRKMFFHLCGAAADIIAWRPLPEPYKAERSRNEEE